MIVSCADYHPQLQGGPGAQRLEVQHLPFSPASLPPAFNILPASSAFGLQGGPGGGGRAPEDAADQGRNGPHRPPPRRRGSRAEGRVNRSHLGCAYCTAQHNTALTVAPSGAPAVRQAQ